MLLNAVALADNSLSNQSLLHIRTSKRFHLKSQYRVLCYSRSVVAPQSDFFYFWSLSVIFILTVWCSVVATNGPPCRLSSLSSSCSPSHEEQVSYEHCHYVMSRDQLFIIVSCIIYSCTFSVPPPSNSSTFRCTVPSKRRKSLFCFCFV